MKTSLRLRCLLAVLLCGFVLAPGRAMSVEVYRVGSAVAPFSSKDQFGSAFTLPADCAVLLVSFEMATGKEASRQLSPLGADFLPKKRAVYVANIHGMPAIGRVFALPKMRSYAHRIVLADSPDLLTPFPRQAQRVTVLHLAKGKVTAIRYWNPATEDITAFLKNR